MGDSTTDEDISFLEDVTDTLADYETKAASENEWERKYRENDASWRERYIARFNGSEVEIPSTNTSTEVDGDKPLTYDNLFKEE